jgi:O-antigen/teichoic acid export membrane protein
MCSSIFWGIFALGFVFGYLLFYAVRHTKEFKIEMLSVAIGAVGSATVIGLFRNYQDWIAPYGLGLLAGFMFYFLMAIILLWKWKKKFDELADNGILSKP